MPHKPNHSPEAEHVISSFLALPEDQRLWVAHQIAMVAKNEHLLSKKGNAPTVDAEGGFPEKLWAHLQACTRRVHGRNIPDYSSLHQAQRAGVITIATQLGAAVDGKLERRYMSAFCANISHLVLEELDPPKGTQDMLVMWLLANFIPMLDSLFPGYRASKLLGRIVKTGEANVGQ